MFLAHNCESKNCAKMLTEEGLKKAVGQMTRGLCVETGEIKPALNCLFFRGGACVHMYFAATGKGQVTLPAQASLRGVNRSRRGPVAPTHHHIHANMAKATDSHPLILKVKRSPLNTNTLGRA